MRRAEEEVADLGARLAPRIRIVGDSENNILFVQGNLASTYQKLGRREEAMLLRRDVYSGNLKLLGAEHFDTLREAHNYATSLFGLERFEEGKALLRRTIPVARRVLGEVHDLALTMRWLYAAALCEDPGATLDDVREAVTTLEDAERIARRVLGGAHPLTDVLGYSLRESQVALRSREAGKKVVFVKK